MRYSLSTLALTALASCACVSAIGINCLGEPGCDKFYIPYKHRSIASILSREIEIKVNDTRWYQNEERIACVDGVAHQDTTTSSICAYLKGTGGIPGNEIKQLAKMIVDNKCKSCGSVPVYYGKGDNDVAKNGMLTFNHVIRDTNLDGRCFSLDGFTDTRCHYE